MSLMHELSTLLEELLEEVLDELLDEPPSVGRGFVNPVLIVGGLNTAEFTLLDDELVEEDVSPEELLDVELPSGRPLVDELDDGSPPKDGFDILRCS